VKLKKKAWWENVKVWIILGFVVLALLVILLIVHSGGVAPLPTGEVAVTPNETTKTNMSSVGGKLPESTENSPKSFV